VIWCSGWSTCLLVAQTWAYIIIIIIIIVVVVVVDGDDEERATLRSWEHDVK
jgi:hypothetical protein